MKLHNTHEAIAVSDSDIAASTFNKTKVTGASFDDVDLGRATFTNVNLKGATFSDVNLSNASIENANLNGARIDGILIDELLQARHRASAVVYVKDMARMQRFYESVAGCSVEQTAEDYVVLQSATGRLVLVRVPGPIASTIEITDPPRRRSENSVKLILAVASIAFARDAAPLFGGELLPSDREWEFDRTLVCDGFDPEGNVVQFQQSA
ncbi:MAG TPA: pentapeptide repeat-containing protein [Gemmatimonadaceae bacterium]|jgi:predicted enzyme related to lactoylglutathione lyase